MNISPINLINNNILSKMNSNYKNTYSSPLNFLGDDSFQKSECQPEKYADLINNNGGAAVTTEDGKLIINNITRKVLDSAKVRFDDILKCTSQINCRVDFGELGATTLGGVTCLGSDCILGRRVFDFSTSEINDFSGLSNIYGDILINRDQWEGDSFGGINIDGKIYVVDVNREGVRVLTPSSELLERYPLSYPFPSPASIGVEKNPQTLWMLLDGCCKMGAVLRDSDNTLELTNLNKDALDKRGLSADEVLKHTSAIIGSVDFGKLGATNLGKVTQLQKDPQKEAKFRFNDVDVDDISTITDIDGTIYISPNQYYNTDFTKMKITGNIVVVWQNCRRTENVPLSPDEKELLLQQNFKSRSFTHAIH